MCLHAKKAAKQKVRSSSLTGGVFDHLWWCRIGQSSFLRKNYLVPTLGNTGDFLDWSAWEIPKL